MLALLLLSGLQAPAAQAHASLVSTDPAEGAVLPEAPETITLTFNEPVTLGPDSTRLYDAAGEEVASEGRSVDATVIVAPGDDLTAGTFVLTYRVVSADGHPVAGSLSFSVGTPSDTVVAPNQVTVDSDPAVTTVHGLLQGVTYLALLCAAGLAVFLALLLPHERVLADTRRRLLRLLRIAAALAVTGSLLLVPVGAVYQQGSGLSGLGTRAAWTGLQTLDGLPFLLVLVGLSVASTVLTEHPPDHIDRLTVTAAAATALAALPMVGHTRSFGPTALVVASDVVHVAAGALWFGGLLGLALSLRALAKRERLAAATLARFSTLAGGLLALVAGGGVLLGWRILGSWTGLFTTTYGVLLLTKSALVGLVAAVAGWNRYRLLPQVLTATGHEARVQAASRLRSAVRLEATGLAVVLLLTGFLVNQTPQEETAGPLAPPPDTVSTTSDEVRVVAHLSPGTVGPNTVTVQVQDLAGEPLEPYANPTVAVSSTSVDLGSRPARNVDSGTYEARVVLPAPGRWQIRVSVRTDQFTNPVLTSEADVNRR